MSEQEIVTAALREARKSVAALLLELPREVWVAHKGTVENAIALLVAERLERDAEIKRLQAALALMLQAFDPNDPAACHQDCFDTSDGHGYEMQRIAIKEAREALRDLPAPAPASAEQ